MNIAFKFGFRKKGKRNTTWEYFKELDNKTPRCLTCVMVIGTKGHTSSMVLHLRIDHSNILFGNVKYGVHNKDKGFLFTKTHIALYLTKNNYC